MSEITIKPITGSQVRIVVEPAPAETVTAGGIIIPDSAQEKPQQGTIYAVGNETNEEKLTLKVGDKVLYGKYSGVEFKIDGKNLLAMKESDVILKFL